MRMGNNKKMNHMKTVSCFTFITILLLTVACEKEKDFLIPASEIPDWLQAQIKEDEKTIASDTKRMPNFGAWIRYTFNNEYYYEYDNPLSALSRNPYSWKGVRVDVTQVPYTNYWQDKCCEQYVWKAPKYTALE